MGGLQRGARAVLVERGMQRSVSAHALVDLDHGRGQRLRLVDGAGEDVGSLLRPNRQRIAEPARDRQQHGLALAFEQGIGGDGGADADVRLGQGAIGNAGQLANGGHRRIPVTGRIVRQQLGRLHFPVRAQGDDIGEGAAPVDPEMPFPAAHGAALCRIAALATIAVHGL